MNANQYELEIIDILDPDQIQAYEEVLFAAFAPLDNAFVRQNWDWDFDRKRAKTRMPYADQILYVVRNQERHIVGSFGFNLSRAHQQFTAAGFAVPDEKENYAEAFNTFLHPTRRISIFRFLEFYRIGVSEMARRNYQALYGICPNHLLKFYFRMGGSVIESRLVHGQQRNFIGVSLLNWDNGPRLDG